MNLNDLQLVLKTAELGSITAATQAMGIRLAAGSAAIKRVEETLGAELFVRSTRRLRVSTAGEKFLPQCHQALDLLKQAQDALGQQSTEVNGTLRITVSSDFGRNLLVPWLDEMIEQNQNLDINITLSDTLLDFYRNPVDVALRYGAPPDNALVGFKICDVPRVLCASPGYINTFGAPTHPQSLGEHSGLFYQLGGISQDSWTFYKGKRRFNVRMQGRRTTNDADLVRRWCIAGKGLALKSALDMAADIQGGRVQTVMNDFIPAASELWLICPTRQQVTPAVRLLRDTLRIKCAQILDALDARDNVN